MLLIDKSRLMPNSGKNPDDPMHVYAVQYERGLKEIKKRFPEGEITFVRPGYPHVVDGLTAKGTEIKVPYPTAPVRFPLQTLYTHPDRGVKELWACCLDAPVILDGGQWDMDKRKSKSFSVEERIVVDINKEPEFAFYLYFISNAVKSGQLKIDDPKADIKAKADIKRQEIERETAIWNVLNDEDNLRKVSAGYGIADAMKKEPDALRFELQDLLKLNDEKQKRDPSIKGTKEFLEDLKINDNVRLRAFIRTAIDNSIIKWNPDGRYKVADRPLLQVPKPEIGRRFDYLCNYMAAPNNLDKLQELMTDVVDKTYLDGVGESKDDLRWLAKVMSIDGYYNKGVEQVRQMVYEKFNVTL
jgi:hypothetical protein